MTKGEADKIIHTLAAGVLEHMYAKGPEDYEPSALELLVPVASITLGYLINIMDQGIPAKDVVAVVRAFRRFRDRTLEGLSDEKYQALVEEASVLDATVQSVMKDD